jgi:hypothetical protein
MPSDALHKVSRVKTLPVRSRDGAQKIDYSDPFVQALFSPVIIARLKEILAEEDAFPQLQGDLKP